jgi:hypothetical protein
MAVGADQVRAVIVLRVVHLISTLSRAARTASYSNERWSLADQASAVVRRAAGRAPALKVASEAAFCLRNLLLECVRR